MESKPWLPYLATEYIRQLNPREVFEWGSGNSTLFFAIDLKIRSLVSIEHDINWYNEINNRRKKSDLSIVDYQYIPFEDGEICGDKSDPCCYKSGSTELGPVNFKKYASVIDNYGLFDLILIDGMARASCLVHAHSHVRPGGLLF